MTNGRGGFDLLNAALLLVAAVGAGLFMRAEAKVASPLIQVAMVRDPTLGAGLAASMLVATVLMATLVVGPFYLARALALDTALVGAFMSAGPLTAALAGVPAGRMVERFGAWRMAVGGLIGVGTGCGLLFMIPATSGSGNIRGPSDPNACSRSSTGSVGNDLPPPLRRRSSTFTSPTR